MIILPAIDIKDGNCVRLFKGDYATVQKVAESPYIAAQGFADAGAEWMHMVDLDGAKDAKLVNADLIADVAKASGLSVEVGGGIRDMKAVEYYLSRGINRVILGSAAVKNQQLVIDAVKEYGERIVVGIDAKDGMVRAEGWIDNSELLCSQTLIRTELLQVLTLNSLMTLFTKSAVILSQAAVLQFSKISLILQNSMSTVQSAVRLSTQVRSI